MTGPAGRFLARPWTRRRPAESTTAADRGPGPWAIALLGGLAVLAVAAMGVLLAREFDRDAVTASAAQEGAEVADTLIETIDLVQLERGLATLAASNDAGTFEEAYEARLAETEDTVAQAVAVLQDWAQDDIAAPPAPPLSEQLVQARQSSASDGVAFDVYSEMVQSLILALTELTAVAPDPQGSASRSAVVRLVRSAEVLAQQRAVVGVALQSGSTIDRDLALRLQISSADFRREMAAAAALVDPALEGVVNEVLTGPESETLSLLVDGLSSGTAVGVTVQEWRAASGDLIESVKAAALVLNDVEMDRLDQLEAASRSNLRMSVALLGGAFVVSLITAWAGYAASSERTMALREHVALVDGLRHWFETEAMPPVDGVDIQTAYRASGEYTRTGGDWIEVYPLPSGHVILGVGDVVGHGGEAVAQMVMIKNMLRGQAVEGSSLVAGIERLDQALSDSGTVATLFYCVLDPSRRSLRWISAGHVPAILRLPDGRFRLLEGGPTDAIIGFGSDRPRSGSEEAVEPGTTLILYTDGLVEAPGEDMTAAIHALAATEEKEGEPFVDTLLAQRIDQRDDVAILVARW